MNPVSLLSAAFAFALLPTLFAAARTSPQDPGNKYIGAKACKMCHGSDKGDPHGIWSKTSHAKAFETLGGKDAKAIAKKLDIADPQKDDKCLKCHVAGLGVPQAQFKTSFKVEDGVQCESCHGPGSKHQAARTAAAGKNSPPPVGKDEILLPARSMEFCTKCHNPESPSYKPFCLKERMPSIEHLDPRKKRTEEELKSLRDACTCEKCKKPAKAPEAGK